VLENQDPCMRCNIYLFASRVKTRMYTLNNRLRSAFDFAKSKI